MEHGVWPWPLANEVHCTQLLLSTVPEQLTWGLLVIQAPAAEGRAGLVGAGVGPDEGGGGGEGRRGLHLTRGFLI